MAQREFPDLSASGRHLELAFRLTSPVLVLHGLAWYSEHSVGFHLLSLQLTAQAQHSYPMRLVLGDQFVSLPLRSSSSFSLLAQHGHDSHSLPGWEYSLQDNFLHLAQPGVYPNFFRMSCDICMFLGTRRSSSGSTGGSSRLKIGRGTSSSTSFNTPEEPMESSCSRPNHPPSTLQASPSRPLI